MIDFRKLDGRGCFYLLRHGESEGNNDGVLQGRRDYPLSDRGRDQARRAAAWFSREARDIDCLLCSPLARAEQTARILGKELGVNNIEVLDELTELDTGIFTGITLAEARAAYPTEWARFQAESWEGVPGAESTDVLYSRAEAVWDLLCGRFTSGRRSLLAVTHSGLLQWLIKSTLGHRSWMPVFPVANCGGFRLSVDNRAGEQQYYSEWTLINSSQACGE